MFKVLVERPRRSKDGRERAQRLRDDHESPSFMGMRAGYGYRDLNENLAPLRRYLLKQVGRPWNKVFSEICAGIDCRSTVQRHIHQHIDDFIAVEVRIENGRPVDLSGSRYGLGSGVSQDLYVDPRTGLIRLNKHRLSWGRWKQRKRERAAADLAGRRRILSDDLQLLRFGEDWFRVELARLPGFRTTSVVVDGVRQNRETADTRFDIVLRRAVSIADQASTRLGPNALWREREHLYGSGNLHAVSKRQLSSREIREHGLR